MIYKIEVNVLNECGYEEALHGLAKNRKQDDEKMPAVATRLADKDYGHNKFLRFIYLWFDVNAPRYWWQEMDTYQFKNDLFFECTKQSESTMNSLIKELFPIKGHIEQNDHEKIIGDWCDKNFETQSFHLYELMFNVCREIIHEIDIGEYGYGSPEMILRIKQHLPECLMQSRSVCLNYQSLRNMIIQRHRHRLPHWNSFFDQLLTEIEHPELLVECDSRYMFLGVKRVWER